MGDKYFPLSAYSHNKKYDINHHIDYYHFLNVCDNKFQVLLLFLLPKCTPLPSGPFCGKNHHPPKLRFSFPLPQRHKKTPGLSFASMKWQLTTGSAISTFVLLCKYVFLFCQGVTSSPGPLLRLSTEHAPRRAFPCNGPSRVPPGEEKRCAPDGGTPRQNRRKKTPFLFTSIAAQGKEGIFPFKTSVHDEPHAERCNALQRRRGRFQVRPLAVNA